MVGSHDNPLQSDVMTSHPPFRRFHREFLGNTLAVREKNIESEQKQQKNSFLPHQLAARITSFLPVNLLVQLHNQPCCTIRKVILAAVELSKCPL